MLTFYSLYRHTAKLSDYKSGIEEIVGITKSADNKIVIRDAKNQPLNPRIELKNDVTIGVRRNTKGQEQFDELLWYRETQGNKRLSINLSLVSIGAFLISLMRRCKMRKSKAFHC